MTLVGASMQIINSNTAKAHPTAKGAISARVWFKQAGWDGSFLIDLTRCSHDNQGVVDNLLS